MKQPKVLVGCPTYKGKDYCVDEWLNYIKNLKYTNYDILIVDNTADDGTHAKWLTDKYGVEVIHHFKKETSLNALMAECNEILRKRVIDEGYDYLMSIESDVFPPKNIIPRLMNQQHGVVSGMYEIGYRNWKYPLIQIVEPKLNTEGRIGNVRQLWWDEILNFIDGETKQVHGCGIGCTLIHVEILKKIKFRVDPENSIHADSFFYMDLWNLFQYPVYVDTSIMCRHDNDDWGKKWKERNKDFDITMIHSIDGRRDVYDEPQ